MGLGSAASLAPGGTFHPAHRPRPKDWKPGHHPSVPKGCGQGDLPCSGRWVQSEPLGGFWSLASSWEEPTRPLWAPGVWEGGSGKNRAGGLGGPWDAATIRRPGGRVFRRGSGRRMDGLW